MDIAPIDEAERLALLSLCLAYRGRSRLAAALLDSKSAIALSCDEGWRQRPPEHALHRLLHIVQVKAIAVVPIWSWPRRLLRARPWAPALFVRGDVRLLWRTGVAVVGAREAHRDAMRWAGEVAAMHARRGDVVISGGARGIDTAAHRASLEGGRSIAYIGAPADAIYPRHNRDLFAEMLHAGHAIASELLPGDFAGPAAHAARNRFIAAHADRVYIAEADLGSGTLGTAAYAHDYGVPIRISPPGTGMRRSGLDALLAQGRAEIT